LHFEGIHTDYDALLNALAQEYYSEHGFQFFTEIGYKWLLFER